MVMKGNAANVLTEHSERMDVAVALSPPVTEFDAQFEGRLRPPHKIGFVDAQRRVEKADMRHRRFAHAHCPDLFGFNETD